MTDTFELLEKLCDLPGVSGSEDKVREFISARLRKRGRTDNIGNLLAELDDGVPHIALVAHMDEVGLLVTKIEEDGSLRFRKVGGIDDRVLPSRMVDVHASKGVVRGVIGIKPPHLMTDPEEAKSVASHESLRIDLGTRNRRETEKLGVRVLDPVSMRKEFGRLGGDLVVGKPLDNRVGCAVLLQAYELLSRRRGEGRLTFVWSVQEEMGLRGAKVILHTLSPDYVLVIDTCSSGDAPGMDGYLQPAILGKGPVIRYFDSQSIASPRLREIVNEVASAKKLPVQEVVAGGTTDATAIQEMGAAVMPIGVGMRNTHSTTEIISLKDVEHAVKLVVAVVDHLRSKGR